jgi:hypothetical protein
VDVETDDVPNDDEVDADLNGAAVTAVSIRDRKGNRETNKQTFRHCRCECSLNDKLIVVALDADDDARTAKLLARAKLNINQYLGSEVMLTHRSFRPRNDASPPIDRWTACRRRA